MYLKKVSAIEVKADCDPNEACDDAAAEVRDAFQELIAALSKYRDGAEGEAAAYGAECACGG